MNIRYYMVTSLVLGIALFAWSPSYAKTPKAAPKSTYDATYADLNSTLQIAVGAAPGKVDYKALRRNQKTLIANMKNTSAVTEKFYTDLPEKEKIAFLINAYNTFALKIVLDNYPITSIKKIKGFPNPTKLRFFRLVGRDHSLDDVQDMLRKNFSEPRALFALNNATNSSPNLRNEAYVADKLDDQLSDQTKTFLQDDKKNQIDTAAKTMKLSPLFQTYAEDFAKNGGSVQKFVGSYLVEDKPENAAIKKDLDDGAYKVSYFDFDWDLNDKKE